MTAGSFERDTVRNVQLPQVGHGGGLRTKRMIISRHDCDRVRIPDGRERSPTPTTGMRS
jgi:hypothetical protein